MSLIQAQNDVLMLGAVLTIVAIGYWCEQYQWGKKISAPLIILSLGLLLGNLQVVPVQAPLYDVIQSLLVPVAIPLLLFRADLIRVFKESGSMLLAFVLATVVTIIGAFVGASLVGMGNSEAQIVGVLTASYIGGSANFVATAQAIGFSDSSLYLSTLTADALGATFFLVLLMSLPAVSFITKRVPSKYIGQSKQITADEYHQLHQQQASMSGVVNALVLSTLICVVGGWLSSLVSMPGSFIVSITVLSLLVATFAKKLIARIQFDFELGTIFMYCFFATVGAGANVSNLFGPAMLIVLFLIILVVVHLVLLVTFGALFKLDLAELMIASSACILGPAAGAALAAGQGWRTLITPAMLVGILGYAIATIIGIGITQVLS